jgi:tripeptidyl-peptidase-1
MRYRWFSAFSFLTAVLLANLVTPLAPWDDMQVKHTWNAVPVNWETLGHPPAGATIDLYIALKPERESALIDALSEVSNPRHPRHVFHITLPLAPLFTCALLRFRYGEHLLKEQVAELVRPPQDTLELVRAWLLHHGIRSSSISTTHGGAWLTVTDVLVSQANQLLGASYQLYRNTKTNETIIRTVGYALPAVLHNQIQDVAPTTYFFSARVMQQTPRRRSFGPASAQAVSVTARSSRLTVTPSYLRWLYSTNAYVPAATDQNKLGVVGFWDESPSQEDLTRFTTTIDTHAAGAAFTVVHVNGGEYHPNNPNDRSNTDVQYSAAMGYPTPVIFYSVGALGDPFLQFLDYMIRQPDVP